MKPNLISLIILLFLLFLINSKMSEEKRKYLLNKYAKKINLEKGDVADELKKKYYSKNLKDTINYDPAVIESIIEQYEFPSSYNYLEENNITAIVKDQAYCGCCWSHAATSALGYRYHKKGIEVNLSPQDALSCYLRDCDAGNYLIDAQMNLVKNGTLTEGCLPFSSADGITIEISNIPSELIELLKGKFGDGLTVEVHSYCKREDEVWDDLKNSKVLSTSKPCTIVGQITSALKEGELVPIQ